MESLTLSTIIKRLASKNLPLFCLNELGGVLGSNNRQSLYKRIQRLSKSGILQNLMKGKYLFTLKDTNIKLFVLSIICFVAICFIIS